ncbi:coatomer beta C-terminal region-domain-containing protein [Suillus ampliporus]|nr:coatomer beta C-terminal region-domain-containing protein [Suillus ampliporus]
MPSRYALCIGLPVSETQNTVRRQATKEKNRRTKLVLRFEDLTNDRPKANALHVEFSKKSADDPIDYVEDLGKATGAAEVQEDFISNLSRISQLTGFLDPIYAEAYVKMHGFDIFLDVLLVNQMPNTLQNLCPDFATLGDLKLVEQPAVYTIAPHGVTNSKHKPLFFPKLPNNASKSISRHVTLNHFTPSPFHYITFHLFTLSQSGPSFHIHLRL